MLQIRFDQDPRSNKAHRASGGWLGKFVGGAMMLVVLGTVVTLAAVSFAIILSVLALFVLAALTFVGVQKLRGKPVFGFVQWPPADLRTRAGARSGFQREFEAGGEELAKGQNPFGGAKSPAGRREGVIIEGEVIERS